MPATNTSTLWVAIAAQRGEPVPRSRVRQLTPGLTADQRHSALQQALQRGYLQRITTPQGEPAVTITPLCTVPPSVSLRTIFESLS